MSKSSSSFASLSSDCSIAGTTSSTTVGMTAAGDVPCKMGQIITFSFSEMNLSHAHLKFLYDRSRFNRLLLRQKENGLLSI